MDCLIIARRYDGTAAAEPGATQVSVAAADVGWSEVVEYGGDRAEIEVTSAPGEVHVYDFGRFHMVGIFRKGSK